MARLSNPDSWGGANVNGSFIQTTQLNPAIAGRVSIPGFIDAPQALPTHPEFEAKAITCNRFRFSALCFDNYTATWNFGDGSPLVTGSSVVHNYSQPGDYTVTMRLSQGSTMFGSATKTVKVLPLTTSIAGPDLVCLNGNHPSQYFSQVIPGVSYRWTAVNGNIVGPDNLPFADVLWYPFANTGTIDLVITRDSCFFPVTKTVGIKNGPPFTWLLQDSVCLNDSSFALAATPAGGIYTGKGVANGRFYPAVAGVGYHRITYTYSDEVTCQGQLEKMIQVGNCNIVPGTNTACSEVLNSIVVAPNPVAGVLRLKSPYVLKLVQVYNMLGQKVAEGPPVNNSLRLPVMASGVYTALVYCEKDKSLNRSAFCIKTSVTIIT